MLRRMFLEVLNCIKGCYKLGFCNCSKPKLFNARFTIANNDFSSNQRRANIPTSCSALYGEQLQLFGFFSYHEWHFWKCVEWRWRHMSIVPHWFIPLRLAPLHSLFHPHPHILVAYLNLRSQPRMFKTWALLRSTYLFSYHKWSRVQLYNF